MSRVQQTNKIDTTTSDYIPLHPHWGPAEGLFSTPIDKMTKKQMIEELKHRNFKEYNSLTTFQKKTWTLSFFKHMLSRARKEQSWGTKIRKKLYKSKNNIKKWIGLGNQTRRKG